ncbi:MAG: DUF2334 domain-containing protein [Sarcina sp.]
MKKIITGIIVILVLILGSKFLLFSGGSKQSWGDRGKFELLDIKTDDVKLKINGEIKALKNPIYISENRYYIPLTEIVKSNDGEIKKTKDSFKVKFLDKEVIINKKSWIIEGKEEKLKKEFMNHKKNIYISLIDFTNIFDLDTRWDYENKTIICYKDNKNSNIKTYSGGGNIEGAIRFEDVTVDGTFNKKSSEYLECLRRMGKRLGDREIPYYVAWIPRYVNPKRNIDIDPTKVDSLPLAELIYSLDYLTFNKGYIGLHGYTHQIGDEISGVGSEFGNEYPSVEELNSRVKKALKIAEYLDIDISFFEAPHYLITLKQNQELEKNFKYIFNNYNCEVSLNNQSKIIKSPEGNESFYIPTPLYYVADGTGTEMVRKIERLSKDSFAGLFYHPFIELNLVEFTEDSKGNPEMIYKNKSILDKIINSLEKRNVKLIDFNDISF